MTIDSDSTTASGPATAPNRGPVEAPSRPAEQLDKHIVTLEASGAPRRFSLPRGGKTLARIALPIALVVVWELLCRGGVVPPTKLDSPTTIASALADLIESGTLQESLAVSLHRAGLGFAFGAVVALVLGVVAGLSEFGERAFDALLQMLRTVPFLALIPLFVIWFGVGEQPKITLIAVACIFPIYLNTFAGVRNVDPKVVEAATVFGLSRFAVATRIVLPLALPTILVGIRYAMGVALLALVAAEQVNANSGIGYLALSPRAALRTDIVLAIVVVYAVLGLGVDLLVRVITRLALPWHRTLVQKAGGQ
ncbi:ABC transporter permease [Rhodococcoides yunnanense]|uniref:ABC transporter permease n=1 Tax=Rhodococcoides yunnanense TaxID=278209 RepID=UPI000A03E1A8|nr:ABC transporter permease [Rhodococcus yunnanensis]